MPQCLGDRLNRHGLPPFDRNLFGLHAKRRTDFQPAFTEFPTVDHNDTVSGRAGIRHGRFHRPGARGRQDEYVLGGLEQPLETALYLGEELAECRGAMMNEGLRHAQQDFGRNLRRPRSE